MIQDQPLQQPTGPIRNLNDIVLGSTEPDSHVVLNLPPPERLRKLTIENAKLFEAHG